MRRSAAAFLAELATVAPVCERPGRLARLRALTRLRSTGETSLSRLVCGRRSSPRKEFPMAKKAKGKMEQVKGKAKEAAGKMTGNERMQAEGKTEQIKGKAREATGKTQEQARGVKDSLGRRHES
ncbi:hypothetical protein GCM10017752_66680 [Streptomyces roseoviridis]